ncbi:hypothetical protein [Nostoc sp. FACHB-110]|uniref:hypothetical protein n=1 Tax=Nostoc sp. FACHB-110 TaxID=2692834 RepID=UPI00168A28BD|nr:hypothetical protein [Nostoc sp. FACHB-110]MBD2441581.1 hypothetical protein [Nostoc sp. FACHB-110]
MKISQSPEAKLKQWLHQNRDIVNTQVRLLQRNGVKPPYCLRVCIDGVQFEVDITKSKD